MEFHTSASELLESLRHKPENDSAEVARLRERLTESQVDKGVVDFLCDRATKMAKDGWLVTGKDLADFIEEEPPFAHRPEVDYKESVRVARSLGTETLCEAGPLPPSPLEVFYKELD